MTPAGGSRPRLLVLRALKLGDFLVAVPALNGLRRAFPDHELIYAGPAWLSPVVDLVAAIDTHLPVPGLDDPLPLGRGDIDTAVNLHGSGPESARRVGDLGARRVIAHAPHGGPGAPDWRDDLHERERWVRLVSAFGVSADANEVRIAAPPIPSASPGAAVIHVGAAYGSRHWPVDRFALVARQLTDDGMRVVLTGGAQDRPRAEQVARLAGIPHRDQLAGRASLAELAARIAHAGVVVTVDTGAAHLASAYGTPSVVIFGPAPPELWGPPPGPHVVLTAAGLRRGDAFAAEPDPALLAVEARAVVAAARSIRRSEGRELRP